MFVGIQVFMAGCSSAGAQAAEGEIEQEELQIGFSFDSFVNERWLRDRDMFVSTAKDLGAEVNVQIANGDAKEQVEQIEYFIKKEMDVIVVVATDGSKLSEVLKEAHKEGIKVIAYDRMIKDGNADLYISFDNEKVGELMGDYLVKALPEGGDIYAIEGPESDNNVGMITAGFKKALEGSNLNIIYQVNCKNWSSDLAYTYVNDALETKRNIVAVMCGNDDLANQAIVALSVNRMSKSVLVTGQDADLSACQHIAEGSQAMTVYKAVEEQAKAAAEYACALANGEEPDIQETLSDGTYDVPYYTIDPVAVTKDNLDEIIIDSGFHTREEVYLNVSK